MPSPNPDRVSRALVNALGVVTRRLRQVRPVSELTQPESIALSSLARNPRVTSAELARIENISPQSMGTTLAGLQARGLVERYADPQDGRRWLLELSDEGRGQASAKRTARTDQLADVLRRDFTGDERAVLLEAAPLLERLAKAL